MNKDIPWRFIISHLKGDVDEKEEKLFCEWLQEERNTLLFRELESLWREIREETSTYTPDTDYYWRQMESRMLRKDEKPKSVPLWKFWMAVSVATVLLVLSLTVSFLYNKTEYWTDSSCKLSYSSLSGKSKIILPDSSVVWLNSGSSLRYAVNFFENREVDLSGEALFDVTKDSRHPFVVSTSGVKVRVHGTRFNVNSYSKEENILVTLFQGSVSLEAGGQEAYLHPGERASVSKKYRTLDITSADMFYDSFWASESVRFEAKSLRYITRYLEKWYNVKIEVDPSIPDSQAYTFTIKDESLEVILRIMSRINPISYMFDGNDHVKITHVEPSKK